MDSILAYDYDFLVIGSGFGGSVSALRLSEKGYRTAILEMGKRYGAEDFPKTNWDLKKYLWMPKVGCYGIQNLTLLRDLFILSGVGVGGGSLVYANTLLIPHDRVWDDPLWAGLESWKQVMPGYFETAKRMLGVAENPRLFQSDMLLREYSRKIGRESSFRKTQVGVYFGPTGASEEEGQTFPDPFFGGEGPPRSACTHCGGCMIGCRYQAKNTLDKNYLYLAERKGAKVIPETKGTLIQPLKEGGYRVLVESSTSLWNKNRRALTARNVVLSAGVLGTVSLLLDCKERGTLPNLSPQLGRFVRSNSEAILGATQYRAHVDFSRGIAIGSGMSIDEHTHMEVCRYPKGADALGMLGAVLTDGGEGLPRPIKWLLNCIKNPRAALRSAVPVGWAERTLILLVMQDLQSHMTLKKARRWFWPFSKTLTTRNDHQVPTYIPAANQAARALSGFIKGMPQSAIHEVLFNAPTTAHILGGCAMGKNADSGVIDTRNQVFGYPGLYVIDGSMIGANLGVNPSLTITALAEHAMSHISNRSDLDRQ